MSNLLSGLLSLGRKDGGALTDYDDAKTRAANSNVGVRRKIAKRANVQPEILYFLAQDPDVAVRGEIAKNPSTPVQADEILCRDGDEDVRCRIAEKIARVAPGLSAELAHRLQLRLAKVAPSEAIKPSGGRYSLSDKVLDWQVEFFGG